MLLPERGAAVSAHNVSPPNPNSWSKSGVTYKKINTSKDRDQEDEEVEVVEKGDKAEVEGSKGNGRRLSLSSIHVRPTKTVRRTIALGGSTNSSLRNGSETLQALKLTLCSPTNNMMMSTKTMSSTKHRPLVTRSSKKTATDMDVHRVKKRGRTFE